MRIGIAATTAPIIVMVDADLLGLTVDHIQALVRPVSAGAADMVVGLRDRFGLIGRMVARIDPLLVISGQRCLRREIIEAMPPELTRNWWLEIGMNAHAKLRKARVQYLNLHGYDPVVKEVKWGLLRGLWARIRMIAIFIYVRLVIWHKLRSVM